MPVRGIDTDNDGAFINETLQAYGVREGLVFTRSRAYQKNDQAWIEQKNGAVIRRFVGYERFAGLIAGPCLARLYESVRRYVNVFQPSFQLKSKVRIGAKVNKSYHPPATPCDRLLAHASVLGSVKESLRSTRGSLDPLALLHRIREGQSALAGMRSGEFGSGTERPSLDEFLATLPDLWRGGGAADTPVGGVGPAVVPDEEGSVRGRVGGDLGLAAEGSRRDGEGADGRTPGAVPRTVPRRPTPHPTTPHPGLAASDGEDAGGPRSGKPYGRRSERRRREPNAVTGTES
jgi:hypothetical protein